MKIFNKLFNISISYKTLLIIMIVVFCLLLFPMLYIAKWNVPSVDDFRNGKPVHDAVMNGGGIIDILKSAAEHTKTIYMEWQGTISAVFMFALLPAAFGEQYYVLVPYIMLIPLIFGTIRFINSLFRFFTKSFTLRLIISLTLLIGCTQFVFSPVEAFYWYTGAVYYTFFHGLSLILFSLLIDIQLDPDKSNMFFKQILICLLCAAVGFSNYVTALSATILISALLLYPVIKHDSKRLKLLILPAVVFAVSFYFNVTAPGNAIRQSQEIRNSVLMTINYSIRYALFQLKSWNIIPVLSLYLFLIPVFWKIAEETDHSFRFPLLPLLFSFGFFASMNCPPVYALSHPGYGRSQNLNFYWMVLLIPFNIFYFLGWLQRKNIIPKKFYAKQNVNVCFLLAVLLIFVISSADPHLNRRMVSAEAVRSYRNGEMGTYKHVFNQRLEVLKDPDITDPILRSYPYPRPNLFFFDDITPFPEDWRNQYMSAYYYKNTVRIKRSDE